MGTGEKGCVGLKIKRQPGVACCWNGRGEEWASQKRGEKRGGKTRGSEGWKWAQGGPVNRAPGLKKVDNFGRSVGRGAGLSWKGKLQGFQTRNVE